MQLISQFFRDDGASAEVLTDEGRYVILYYNDEDMLCEMETFTENSIGFVEDAAENWASGIKKTPEVIC